MTVAYRHESNQCSSQRGKPWCLPHCLLPPRILFCLLHPHKGWPNKRPRQLLYLTNKRNILTEDPPTPQSNSWIDISISLMLMISWALLRYVFSLSIFSLVSLSYFSESFLDSVNFCVKFLIAVQFCILGFIKKILTCKYFSRTGCQFGEMILVCSFIYWYLCNGIWA